VHIDDLKDNKATANNSKVLKSKEKDIENFTETNNLIVPLPLDTELTHS